jgi:hypothetical protein
MFLIDFEIIFFPSKKIKIKIISRVSVANKFNDKTLKSGDKLGDLLVVLVDQNSRFASSVPDLTRSPPQICIIKHSSLVFRTTPYSEGTVRCNCSSRREFEVLLCLEIN